MCRKYTNIFEKMQTMAIFLVSAPHKTTADALVLPTANLTNYTNLASALLFKNYKLHKLFKFIGVR